MKILAHLAEMAESEILSYVPANVYQRIRQADDHPTFRAYVIGHEGESAGKYVGIGSIVKRWYKSAIEKLTEKLAIGTKIFHGHDMTNAHKDRIPIGEVVGKAVEKLQEFVSAIAITYIYPQFVNIPLDVASVEVDVTMPSNMRDIEIHDADVKAVTGIALGNSRIEKPGFPRASLLAQLQEFADGKKSGDYPNKKGDKMTPDEIKQAIRDLKLKPSDIFESDEMSSDPTVRMIAREKREAEEGYQRRMEDKLSKEREKWTKEKDEFTAQIKKLNVQGLKGQVNPKFEKIAKERKLEDRQIAFVKKDIDLFEPSDAEKMDSELNTFVDSRLEDFEETIKVLGIKKTDDGRTLSGVGAGEQDAGKLGQNLLDAIPD